LKLLCNKADKIYGQICKKINNLIMNNTFSKVLFVLSLTLLSLGVLSSCITFQEVGKPHKKHPNHHKHPKKKKHPHSTHGNYRISVPQPHPSKGNNGKGNPNGKSKGKGHGNGKSKGGNGNKH